MPYQGRMTRPPSSGASWTSPKGHRTPPPMRCTETCYACAARIRSLPPGRPGGVDGAVLGPGAFVIRFFGEEEDRLLLVNLEIELHLDPAPEPLLAPLDGCTWEVMWSSEDLRYGGSGTPRIYSQENWRLPGRAAILMRPEFAPPQMRRKPEDVGEEGDPLAERDA